MNENKALRFWKWAVILLVLCNVLLLSVMWLRPHISFRKRTVQPRDFVIHELNFSPEQVKQYDSLIALHQAAMRPLKDQSATYRRELFANLTKNGTNANPDSLAQVIGRNQAQIELATYNHFVAVRTICNEEQKTQFDHIIESVTKMMNGPGGNRQGPPPQGHQGPPPPDGPPPGNE